MHEENDHIKLSAKIENPGRTKEIFNLNKTRTEKARGEYTFRTCRLVNRLNQKIEFREMRGLKRRLIQMLWEFFDDQFRQNKTSAHGSSSVTATCAEISEQNFVTFARKIHIDGRQN